jgi:putative salt-induced outer membrane protein
MLDAPPPPAFVAPEPAEDAVPADLKAVIDAAIAAGDDAVIDRVFGFALTARPDKAAAIERLRTAHLADRAAAQTAKAEAERLRRAAAGPLENWEGKIEFGATWATGPASSLGLVGALDVERTGIDWTHKLILRAEVQDTDDVRAVERIIASWQPRRQLGRRAYVFGLGQYERDPGLGYDNRYTAGLGAGWKLVRGDEFRVALEGGPALRLTDTMSTDEIQERIAGRGSLDLGWQMSERLEFTQRASIFYEEGRSSGLIASALDSKVSEKLNLRFSYEYRIEEDRDRGISSSGSISRASLVYRM